MNGRRLAQLPRGSARDSTFRPSTIYNPQFMRPDRISELLGPYLPTGESLSSSNLASISTYIDILQRWNARINLTAIRDPEEMVTRHFGESFFAAQHLFPKAAHAGRAGAGFAAGQRSALSVADVGSGAGFPGVPMKLWAPEISLALIESNQKKATFLREVTRALVLTDINIIAARAETLAPSTFDVVTLRAVERFDAILPIAATLVKSSGCLALLVGSAQLAQARSLLPEHQFSDPLPIPRSTSRVLATARTSQTMREPRQ